MKSTQCISRQSHEACKKVEIYFRQLTGVVDELLLSFKLTTCRDKTRQNFAARLKALFDECAKFYFEILLLQSIKENYFVSSERMLYCCWVELCVQFQAAHVIWQFRIKSSNLKSSRERETENSMREP